MADRAVRRIDVAIIIVSFRSAALTIASLGSIAAERQTSGLSLRVVVVDNASGDLPEIQDAMQRNAWSSWVTLVLAPLNGGFSYGNNLGIRRAYEQGRPDYVHLLNPDTLVRPQAFDRLVAFLEQHPAVGIAGGSFETEDGKPWPFAFRFPGGLSEIEQGLSSGWATRCLSRWVVPRTMTATEQPVDWICGASMMIRPAVLESIGCLDENFFLYYEETEFCHRARLAGFPTWYVPSSRVMHIIGKSTDLDDASRVRKRLPGYWFESRRRYFVLTHGWGGAAVIDLLAILCGAIGLARARLLRRVTTPCFLRDLWQHSPLHARNRQVPEPRTFYPAPAQARSGVADPQLTATPAR